MLSYHWDSHAIACLISLLHGKCQSASVDTSAISLIMNYLGDNSALFAGLSLKSIILIDHPEKKKKVSLIFRCNFLHFSLCPLPYVLATSKKHLLPSFPFPPSSVKFYKLTRFPRAFLSSGCTTLMAQVTAPVQGLNWQHTGKPL